MLSKRSLRWLFAGLSLALSYLAAFVGISVDPYWEDNGVLEYIPWDDRWIWAAWWAPLFLIGVGPVLYGLYRLIGARRRGG